MEAKLRGPHSFPLERLLHIFYALYAHHDAEEEEQEGGEERGEAAQQQQQMKQQVGRWWGHCGLLAWLPGGALCLPAVGKASKL